MRHRRVCVCVRLGYEDGIRMRWKRGREIVGSWREGSKRDEEEGRLKIGFRTGLSSLFMSAVRMWVRRLSFFE